MQGFLASKWWFATLIIGMPTIGYAYYYYTRCAGNRRPHVAIKKKKLNTPEEDGPRVENNQTKIVNQTPLERALHLKLDGNELYRQQRYSDALRCYTEALELCPIEEKEHRATLYQNRAAAYEYLGNVDEVIKNCTEALKLKPLYPKALSRRYKACEKIGDLRQSLEDVTVCCILEHFTNEKDIQSADKILKKISSDEAEKYMKTKSIVFPSKQFVEQYLRSSANDPITLLLDKTYNTPEDGLKGIAAARKALIDGDYEKVLSACDEEINLVKETDKLPSSDFYEALLIRATMNVISNESVKCKADLDSIIDSSDAPLKFRVSALLKRACFFVQNEQEVKGFEDFEQAQILDPTNSDVYHQKAQVLLLCDKANEAIAQFDKSLEMNPNFPIVKMQKLYTEYKIAADKNDVRKAFKYKNMLKDTVNSYPNTEGYLLLAQIHMESQEFEQADEVLSQAIKRTPQIATNYVHRGVLHLQWKGDQEFAMKEIQKAIELDPKCGFAYESMASVEFQRGNMLQAISFFDKALPLTKCLKEASHIISLKIASQTQHTIYSNYDLH